MSKLPVARLPVVLFAQECDRGALREENQDSVLHVHIPLGDLLMVADGIGGYTGGATASRMAVEHFFAHLASLPHDYLAISAISEAAALANAEILAAARAPDSPHLRMGSTVVLALVQHEASGTHAWIGHIGDSRAYLLRAGRLHRITTDHSAVQALLSRNLITPEEAKNHPDASVLTRSLGHKPEVEIEIEQIPLAVGDTLLLCSDGLWGFVPEQEIEKAADAPGLTLEAAAHNLLELALAAGGQDNIGIEMAQVIAPPEVDHTHRQQLPAWVIWAVLAFFVLGIAGLFVLAYLALWSY